MYFDCMHDKSHMLKVDPWETFFVRNFIDHDHEPMQLEMWL